MSSCEWRTAMLKLEHGRSSEAAIDLACSCAIHVSIHLFTLIKCTLGNYRTCDLTNSRSAGLGAYIICLGWITGTSAVDLVAGPIPIVIRVTPVDCSDAEIRHTGSRYQVLPLDEHQIE